jgi:PAS domain S-box-containing protein
MMVTPMVNKGYRLTVAVSAYMAGVLSLAMLVGGSLGLPGMGYFSQGPLASSLLMFLSIALVLAPFGPGRPVSFGLALVVLAGGVSLAALVAYGFASGPARISQARALGLPMLQVSVLTCLSTLALSLAYLSGVAFPGASWSRRQASALLAMLPMGIGAVALVSYPEGVRLINGAQSVPMSLPSAVCSLLLGLAALMTVGIDTWPLALFGSETTRTDSMGGRRLRHGPLRLFLVLTLGILCLGSLYLRGQVKAAHLAAEKQLAATAEAKVRETASWFDERQADADQLFRSSILQEAFRRFLEGRELSRPALLEWMESLSHCHGCVRIELFDAQGVLRLAWPDEGQVSPGVSATLREVLKAGNVKLVDLHRNKNSRDVRMGFWVPVGQPREGGGMAEGAVYLQVDARQFLYPLLASTDPASSTETILVRREGGEALFLSELRHRPDAAVNLSLPIAWYPDSPAVKAALGKEGIGAGLDYRGGMVIADVRRIPGTPWHLVTKVDEAEIYGPLRLWGRMTAGSILGVVLLLAMGMGLMVRQGDARRSLALLAFERERKALSERFSKAFSTSPESMVINRMEDGVYLDVNEGFTRVTGYTIDEIRGRSPVEEDLGVWVHNEDRNRMVEGLQSHGEVVGLEAPFRRKDGSIFIGLMSAKFLEMDSEVCVISSTHDISPIKEAEEERRVLEAQLHQVQKQESLGALAGGVAHDMNNVMGAILSLASAHRAEMDSQDPMAASFDTIIQACMRGRGVVRSLLYFARKDLEDVSPLDLNALVLEVIQLLSHTTLQRLNLETSLQEGLWTVQGDSGALSHAIMNLCVNAMDAMPGRGTLLLKTENLPEGRVQLTVTDDGEGMSAEVQEKAMEPFFTTKPTGKGTGLGLAMVFGTVKAHGGTLEIRSRLGEGTSVLMAFPGGPAVQAASASEWPAPKALPPALDILLVDDDELILASVAPMLELCGHKVRCADGGLKALEILQKGPRVQGGPGGGAADLVILDLNMPGMTGSETLVRILEWNPGQPVLLASGYIDGDVGELMAGHPTVSFIQKPFSLPELQARLAEMERHFS